MDESSGARGVRAVERAVELLFRLAEYPSGTSLHQLAQDTRWSKSTIHRLLGTLERLGVVERDRQTRAYRIGPRLRQLAQVERTAIDLRQVARPEMERLRALTGETVTLHEIDRGSGQHVVVEQCESPEEVRRVWSIGQRLPVLSGAASQAMLAWLAADEIEAVLMRTRSADDPGPTRDDLQAVRSKGYAFSLSKRVPGGSSISAPIRGPGGRLVGAVSISGPTFRFTLERADACASALVQSTARVSARLGCSEQSCENEHSEEESSGD